MRSALACILCLTLACIALPGCREATPESSGTDPAERWPCELARRIDERRLPWVQRRLPDVGVREPSHGSGAILWVVRDVGGLVRPRASASRLSK